MASKNASELVYLVLHVRQGVHFDGWRKIRLRIAPCLEKQYMVSDYVLAVPEPIFNIYFVWCLTEPHLRLLQRVKRDIVIGVVAEQAGKTWSTGFAKLGIQHAQLCTPHIALQGIRLPVQLINAPVETELQPELLLTLTIQLEFPVDKRAQIHVMHLTEPPEAKQPESSTNSSTGNMLNTTDKPSTSKNITRDNSSECKLSEAKQSRSRTNSLTGGILKTTPSASKNVKRDNSSEHEPSPKPNERKQSKVAETTTKNVRFQDPP